MNTVDDFLMEVAAATKLPPKQLSGRLLLLLRLHPQLNPAIVTFNSVGNLDEKQINAAVDSRRFFNDDWMAFGLVVVSFIRLANQIDPWSMLESFDLYSTYINDLSVAFTNKNHGYLVTPLIEDALEFVVPLATQLDFQLVSKEMNRKPRLTYLASIMLKVFNNIRSQLGAGDQAEAAKKSIMLFIGTKLCLTYFKLSNPLLCRNVFSNMNNASLEFHRFPMNQQIQYRYYLAKFYLVKYQFVDAYQHLVWCLDHCPSNYTRDNSNISRILRDLIPIAIILGKRPNFASIYQRFYSSAAQAPRFLTMYAQMMTIVKSGSFSKFQEFVAANYAELKRHKLLLVVATKSCVVILRNLVRRLWIIQGTNTRLDYNSIATALATSLQGLPLARVVDFDYISPTQPPTAVDDQLVENCLITLIDQNLLKGKLFPRLRVVSLSKTGPFPAVDTIDFVKFGNGPEGTLSYTDKWMN